MKAREWRMMLLTVSITLGLSFAVSQWQTQTLRAQLQVLEGKLEIQTERTNQTLITLANAKSELERLRARGEVLSMSLEATRGVLTADPGDTPGMYCTPLNEASMTFSSRLPQAVSPGWR